MNNDIIRIGGGNSSPSQPKKVRSSNLELYRIMVMLLIVAHHYVVNSGLKQLMSEDPLSANSLFYYLLGAWGKIGINCFVLITGYFMCTSEITLRKFLKLFMWIITYGLLITGVFIAFDYHPTHSTMQMLTRIVPMRHLSGDFCSCFLVFFLCIPFLNKLVQNMNKRMHQMLMVLLLFIYTLHTVPGLSVTMNYVSWFCVLYIIASYLRLHPLPKDKDAKFWGYMTALSWGSSILSILFIQWFNSKGHSLYQYILVSDSNSILALTNGITSFMWFKNLKIKNSKLINTIAASSFGVLLIHANSDTMRHWLWKDTVDCIGHYDTPYYWLYAIGCVLLIYIICTIIDIIRIRTIETPILNFAEKLCLWIKSKFYNSLILDK